MGKFAFTVSTWMYKKKTTQTGCVVERLAFAHTESPSDDEILLYAAANYSFVERYIDS